MVGWLTAYQCSVFIFVSYVLDNGSQTSVSKQRWVLKKEFIFEQQLIIFFKSDNNNEISVVHLNIFAIGTQKFISNLDVNAIKLCILKIWLLCSTKSKFVCEIINHKGKNNFLVCKEFSTN